MDYDKDMQVVQFKNYKLSLKRINVRETANYQLLLLKKRYKVIY
jgi:hypothetical protein